MHEVAVIQGAVCTALESMERAGAARVTHMELEVGVSGHVTEEAIRQYLEMLTVGTPAEGTSLRIVWLPATYQCFDCLHRFKNSQAAVEIICPRCGGTVLEIDHQETCSLCVIDVAFDSRFQPGEQDLIATMLVREEEASHVSRDSRPGGGAGG